MCIVLIVLSFLLGAAFIFTLAMVMNVGRIERGEE